MLIFALDTSTPSGSFALLRDGAIVGQCAVIPDESYSPNLLRYAASLLESSRISLEQIDLFAVCAGPGSFTGLRIGLTTAKGWSEIWNKPIAAVSGLEAVAAQAAPSCAAGSLLGAVLDARRGQIFGGLFRVPEDRSGSLDPIGVEVQQQINPQARILAESRGIACVEVELAVLRGEREPELKLFAA